MQRPGLTTLLLVTMALIALPAQAQEGDITVEDGGIHVDGWMGTLDNGATGSVAAARLAMDGDALHVMTGPQISYWSPGNVATGSYTVSASFTEPSYMNLNNHPHPYGLFIGGHDLDSEQAGMLYCAAYGNGGFIVRGFGPESFQMNGRRAEMHDAVHKAAGQGESVSQDIAISVSDDAVSCMINGTTVASYPKSEVVGEGKLSSTDGIYGIRFGHNTEGVVSNLSLEAN